MTRRRTLVVPHDFPTRQGGGETFVHAMTNRFPTDSVVLHTSAESWAAAHDVALPRDGGEGPGTGPRGVGVGGGVRTTPSRGS
jgi:hypothetical protein